jgi:hypothetical protein
MCGYCFEQGYILPYMAIEYQQQDSGLLDEYFRKNFPERDPTLEMIIVQSYLQESDHLEFLLEKVEGSEILPKGISTILCRLFEKHLENGFNPASFESLTSFFDQEALRHFLAQQREINFGTFWQTLWNVDTLATQESWEAFLSEKDQLLSSSVTKLARYYEWWISGSGKIVSDPVKRMDETGIYDAIEEITPEDWERFALEFPGTFFALSYVAKYLPQAEVLKKIALQCPKDVPDFFAHDLWLQRRAFLHCVKEYGPRFIIENTELNRDNIRIELIHYVLLKTTFAVDELRMIQRAIRSDMESEPTLQFIETLLAERP